MEVPCANGKKPKNSNIKKNMYNYIKTAKQNVVFQFQFISLTGATSALATNIWQPVTLWLIIKWITTNRSLSFFILCVFFFFGISNATH